MDADTIKFSCHCKAIRITVARKSIQEPINDCMCSICRRYGAAWIYPSFADAQIEKNGPTKPYLWGDKKIEFTWCEQCGCLVYWWPLSKHADGFGVNTRCVDQLDDLKHLDRRITWAEALLAKDGLYDENGPLQS